MTSENSRMAYQLMMDFDCTQCDEPVNPANLKLESTESSDAIFESVYDCNNCDATYDIEIKDEGGVLSAEIDWRSFDTPTKRSSSTMFSRKDSLYAQSHSARDLVEGLRELIGALNVMRVNQNRIAENCELLRQPGGFHTPDKFDTEANADVHNYLASAYSFSEILATVESDLPTDGPVDIRKKQFDIEKRAVMGLRIFAQHNLNLPLKYSDYNIPETGKWRTSIIVELEDVSVIESGITGEFPDGYENGSSHHYGDVNGDIIDVDKLSENHYDAAVELVKVITEHADGTRGDELEEYFQLEDVTTDVMD